MTFPTAHRRTLEQMATETREAWGEPHAEADAIDAALTEIDRLTADVDALIDVLADVIAQACGTDDGRLDSGALSAYAEGIRALATRGRVTIEVDVGRRVIARWTARRAV